MLNEPAEFLAEQFFLVSFRLGVEERTDVHKILVEKPERRRPLGRHRRRWEDNIKMDLVELRWGTD